MMKKELIILIIVIILMFLVIGTASASQDNSTDIILIQENETADDTIKNQDTNQNVLEAGEEDDEKLSAENNQSLLSENIDDENYTIENKTDLYVKTDNNLVKKGYTVNIYLTDEQGNLIADKKLNLTYNGKTIYKTTDKNGKVSFKADFSKTTTVIVEYDGDDYYNNFTGQIDFYIDKSFSIIIGNTKLLSNGYLRIYLKGSAKSIAYKTVRVKIGDKVFTKKTNAEGFIVLKPNMNPGTIEVEVAVDNYVVSKKMNCIKGDAINPFKKNVPKVNGVPDIDWMNGNFVMADNDAKYTLKKSQYREAIKRDSYSLYLYGKLTKYTFFKTKSSPKIYHMIKREKWNVIERELNKKLVKKNKYNYWPKTITVSLKGKSYTYSEVRDVQNKGYTCGPTSASVCSQALRNYYSEKFFQVKAHVTNGVNIPVLKKVLNKNNFKSDYFYTDSFNSALKKLGKGGAALIAYLPNHYVSIIDVSKNGKKILVSNSYGKYNVGGASKVPTKWVSVKYFKSKFAGVGLVVKLKYKLSKTEKAKMKNFYKSMGSNWSRQNTNERIPNT